MENPEVLPPDFQARAVFVRAPPTPSLLAEMASSWSGWRTKKRGEPFDSPLGFVDILHPHLDAVELGDSSTFSLPGHHTVEPKTTVFSSPPASASVVSVSPLSAASVVVVSSLSPSSEPVVSASPLSAASVVVVSSSSMKNLELSLLMNTPL